MDQSIPLTQKLYLLGIHPEKGGLISSSYSVMNYNLVGALFLELYLNKNISFDEKKVILKNEKTSNPLHSFVIEKLKQKQKALKISTWLSKMQFSQGYIRKEVQKGLVQKRIIALDNYRFLFIKWNKSKILNMPVVYRLISEIENMVFKGTENEEDIMLMSMLRPAGLVKRIFPDREKRINANEKLKNLMTGNQVSVAVSEAIAAAHAVAASIAVTAAVAGMRK